MKIVVQTGGLYPDWGVDCQTVYRMIRDAGIEGVDWGFFRGKWRAVPDELERLKKCASDESINDISDYFADELTAISDNDLEISQAHAPFPAYIKGCPEITGYAVNIYKKLIRFCDTVSCPYIVIHGISRNLNDETQTLRGVHEMNLRLYESLIPVLAETNVTVCLENLFSQYRMNNIEGMCSDPYEAVWYIDYLNGKAGKKCFGLCLDTGHLNLLGKDPEKYIKILGERIVALHIHDNSGVIDNHRAPYTGNISWRGVTAGLRAVGYSGNFSFETLAAAEPDKVDWETVPVWLRTVSDMGRIFRDKLLA